VSPFQWNTIQQFIFIQFDWCHSHLIIDLSQPKGKSINNGIPKELCTMTYITIDEAIQTIVAVQVQGPC